MKKRLPRLFLIFSILGLLVASWFLVHLLAVLGIFLAIAYPLWWLFAPEKTICFLCRAQREGTTCPFCHRVVRKSEGTSPRSLSSAIFNGGLILVFSIVSFGVVFGESKLLFKLGFPPTPKTASFIIPSRGQYRLGEVFPMKIEISNLKNAINAVQADIGFDPQKIEVVDVSTKDSFANIFLQKEINNEAGWARLTGGLPNPGFFADHGTFGTVYFKGKSPGLVRVEFLGSSLVLANDGRGTNVLKELPSASYLILPEKISPEEEEEQQKLISQANVLGESTDNTQMKFYEEGSVLGAQVGQEIEKEEKFSLGKVLLGFLENIDRTILSFWGKIFFR
jgi:hypothetical protein